MGKLKALMRIFLILGGSLLAVAGLLMLLFGLVLLRPSWFVHEKSLRWSAEHFLKPMGIVLEFSRFEATFTRDGLLKHRFTLTSRDLRLTSESLDLTLPQFSLAAAVDLHPSRLTLTHLGPASLTGGLLSFRMGPPEADTEETPFDKKWYRLLNSLEIDPLQLQFDRVSFTPYQQEPITAAVDIRLSRSMEADRLWQLTLLAQALKIPTSSLYADVPLTQASLNFRIDPELGFLMQTLGPLKIQAEEIRFTQKAPEAVAVQPLQPPQPTANEEQSFPWIEQLKNLRLAPSAISIKKFAWIRPDESPMSGTLELKIDQTQSQQMKLDLIVDKVKGIPLRKARLSLDAKLPSSEGWLPLQAELQGSADLDRLGQASLEGSLDLASLQSGHYDLRSRYRYGPSRFEAASRGELKDGKFNLTLAGSATQLHERLQKIAIERCAITGAIDEKAAPFLASNLNCRVAFTRPLEAAEANYQDLLPRTATIELKGPFTIPAWNEDPRFTAPLAVVLEPLVSEAYRLTSRTDINLGGRLLGGAAGITGTVDLDTSLVLPSFQNLVKRFSQTAYSIPAPFATLDGLVRCDLKGRIRIKGILVNMPFSCKSELDSTTQTVWIDVTGLIETRSQEKPLIQADILLEKVTFELPKIAVDEPIPQIMPDKRITELKYVDRDTEAQPLPIELDLQIKTRSGRPLKLATLLTPVPIPITIDLAIRGDKPLISGSVAVEEYDVAFFKKKAFINRLALRFEEALESPQLEGLVVFKDPDFRIDLKLSGSVDQPFYTLESRPPRTQSEILSIILFGGGADSLDVDNQRSVEDTRAAMVDGAIGLMSMYYLAATPIETVGYNPHTGIFRARVRLGQTLSLMVGSDLGGANQSIGLRKRLTENWSFETTAETDEETKANHGLAMFRWGRRY